MGKSVGVLLRYLACLLQLALGWPAPLGPCEQRVVQLEAELREQQLYIEQLHASQARQLENIPNLHLGPENQYRDCSEVFAGGNVASGLYQVRPSGAPTAFSVFCDMNNGGGWTVFQRRTDGQESFDRAWVEYKNGFGDQFSPKGEFWLGNEPLHYITSQGDYELRINMEDFEGNQRFAEYKNFKVDEEKDQYQLHLGEYTAGDAGDALGGSSPWARSGPGSAGLKFRTVDRPGPPPPRLNGLGDDDSNDHDDQAECIRLDKSGWWSSRCEVGNLNGHYYKGPYEAMAEDGVVWYTWHGWWYSIKSVVMMVRAADMEAPPPSDAPVLPWQPQPLLDNMVEEAPPGGQAWRSEADEGGWRQG
ncbi:unnamed protein product [Boreogadus saida]